MNGDKLVRNTDSLAPFRERAAGKEAQRLLWGLGCKLGHELEEPSAYFGSEHRTVLP